MVRRRLFGGSLLGAWPTDTYPLVGAFSSPNSYFIYVYMCPHTWTRDSAETMQNSVRPGRSYPDPTLYAVVLYKFEGVLLGAVAES